MSTTGVRTLRAKSKPDHGAEPPTIEEHCLAVLAAAEAIWDAIESDLAQALSLNVRELQSSLRPLYLIAALLHDIAKANSGFQSLVYQDTPWKKQPVRHEILAAVLLMEDRIWGRWFATSLNERDRWAVIWAIGGHHRQLRAKRENDPEDPLFTTGGVAKNVVLHLDDGQVQRLLNQTRILLTQFRSDPGAIPDGGARTYDPLDDGLDSLKMAVRKFVRQAEAAWRKHQKDRVFQRTVALLKALLIAADIAGSALPSAGESVADWVRKALRTRLVAGDAQKIAADNLQGRRPHTFQTQVAESQHTVTVVAAGCGNGKTTAAYLWAENRARYRKLFFAYPTTGTASAGFCDYLFAQTNLERTLIHGRAVADLEAMNASPPDDVPPTEQIQRLESLNAWGQQAIACTVDTVLGLMQNQRRPLFAFPALACGAFVFDEVHNYDRRMFAELLRFLETFPEIPVLIMSASIPPARWEALRRIAGDRMNETPIRGDHAIESILRYRIFESTEEDCWSAVGEAVAKNQKVLWVCNTVKDAVEMHRRAHQTFRNANILLYHSRLRYGGKAECPGRVERQNQVIAGFAYEDKKTKRRAFNEPTLAITTQVCEMSLDISADLLVSACCPLPSLVQRLGRLNRYASQDDPWPAFVYPFAGPPYHKQDFPVQMEHARNAIRSLAAQPCSQQHLANFLNQMQSSEGWSDRLNCAWLDGGWETEPLPARDGDNSFTIVREEDLQHISHPRSAANVIPWTIPMTVPQGFMWNRRVSGYPVTPKGKVHYDAVEGATWIK
jgi:CRISPR-associated endonuclease/helicase Cas3